MKNQITWRFPLIVFTVPLKTTLDVKFGTMDDMFFWLDEVVWVRETGGLVYIDSCFALFPVSELLPELA